MHHMTGYVDQEPDALRLTLVEGQLSRDQFSLYARATSEIAGLGVDVVVIGASHIITFDVGIWRLHEVFACVALEGVSHWTLNDLVPKPVRRTLPGYVYEFSVRRVAWQEPEPSDLVQLVAAVNDQSGSNEFGVVQEFPLGDLPVTPKTVIFGRTDDAGGVTLQTAHSYPNVSGLVMSRTTLTPEEGER